MEKIEVIKLMLSAGRAKDMLDFVEGESPYLSDASGGVPQDPEFKRIWIMVVHHLRFLAEFGNGVSVQSSGGKVYRPYPDEFDRWLSAGASGISEIDIKRYIEENPLGKRK
ncbi:MULTISPECIES: hypothetical protein [unclassified Burkholderia]|uniref:hypothetical protein n=1 Tax=unclassified Burkholderia TaxID=2613784 RepID=UPI00141EF332|nr:MULTISPECIES: hypothetical protein [unclassified Burkholderia]NIE55141.1 hypothetical protein [Burkholderia sp. Ap-955]NIF13162.1 hypothetical protein [Burkholderia sp. Ax-1735]NIG06398.1 hypothetical protein [Burkholderia sp. Tr-849]